MNDVQCEFNIGSRMGPYTKTDNQVSALITLKSVISSSPSSAHELIQKKERLNRGEFRGKTDQMSMYFPISQPWTAGDPCKEGFL